LPARAIIDNAARSLQVIGDRAAPTLFAAGCGGRRSGLLGTIFRKGIDFAGFAR
jgi:hypothetical protein